MAKKAPKCPPKTITSPKNSLCCNEDDVLARQLSRIFGLPDPQHCTDDFYYLEFNCDTGYANQSLTQLVQTLVNEGITVNVAGILVQAGPNVNEPGGYGVKVTQTGTVFTVQLNTAGLGGSGNILADNGLTKIGSTIQLGGTLTQPLTQIIGTGTESFSILNINSLTFDTNDLAIAIGGSQGNAGEVLTSNGTLATWQPVTATLPPLQNALELNAGTLRWNGDLTLAKTEIRGLGTKDIDFQNIREFWLGTNKYKLRINATTGAPGQVLTADGAGFCEWQTIPSPVSGLSFAVNGLHTIGNTVYLGGSLTDANTVIQGKGTESFSILNINSLTFDTNNLTISIGGSQGNAGDILTSNGVLATWQPSLAALTANNGLTISSGNIQLGGVLVQDTTIFGGNLYDVFFNAIQTYSIEAQVLTISAAGSIGNAGQVLTASGLGACGWENPSLRFPVRIDTNNLVTVLVSDSTVILDNAVSPQTVVLPPVSEGLILIIVQRNFFGISTLAPSGIEKVYDAATPYTGGAPMPIPAGGRLILQGKNDGGGNFWMILSKN